MRTFKTFPKAPRVHLNEWNKALVLGKDDQHHKLPLVAFMKSVQTQQDTNGALSMERGPCANSTRENSQENTEEKHEERMALSLKHRELLKQLTQCVMAPEDTKRKGTATPQWTPVHTERQWSTMVRPGRWGKMNILKLVLRKLVINHVEKDKAGPCLTWWTRANSQCIKDQMKKWSHINTDRNVGMFPPDLLVWVKLSND